MSLRNRTILITRRREQAGEMIREIERKGGRAVVVPMIATGPPASWTACDAALRRIGEFDLVVFTSVNAVESFVPRAESLGVSRAVLAKTPAAAVGETTAGALAARGFPVAAVPESFSGADLTLALGGSLEGKRVLLPRGNLALDTVSDALQASGAVVESVTVYSTGKPEGREQENVVRRVLAGEFDVLTFASPSAAANFAALCGPDELAGVRDHATIAVIGPTTAAALVRGIEEYFGI